MRYVICKSYGEFILKYEEVHFDGPLKTAARHFAYRIAYPDGKHEDASWEHGLTAAEIIPADLTVKFDIKRMKNAHDKKEAERIKRATTRKEKQLLRKLKAKYEGEST